ncbi:MULTISPECIES: AraC family transcriptional regulator [unclassified Paenibacillus]|uniref:helix-turn-helix domain-containing protein n=1 Tax=unclassified Paenibacillus TaxID=185978 RepID=UPI0027854194|nr:MULTISPECIES: helix-turn-helix domain-containing protein [unclassified Paenibacillus]MDQ0902160.1 AraC-like DNA-binding protein [Paenibacillus sp. V4I7]MDQ0919346.1 AraC-like DNA-binding protein [Paenibacillus sp. V4I5]
MKWPIFNRQTLVFKIFISFLVIILLFSSFNLLSVHLFGKGVQKEIIQYNRLMLKNTAERYQTHFERMKTILFDLYSDEYVVAFNRQLLRKSPLDIEFSSATEFMKPLRAQAYNPMLYLHNVLIHFNTPSIVFEKEGSVEADMLFSQFYVSEDYPLSFWENNLRDSRNYRLHAEETFTVSTLNSALELQLIPFSFRVPASNYQVIALLDANLMREAYYGEEDNRQFMILEKNGSLLYSTSGRLAATDIPKFNDSEDYILSGDYYFFRDTPAESSLTYVTAVPYSNIATRVRTATLTLILISGAAIIIGILASVFFSRKINRPVKDMVTLLLRRDSGKLKSTIHEFDLIHQNIRDLMLEKEATLKDLIDKRSLLTSFGYINKLKAIMSDINDWKDIAEMNEPFFIVLYQLHFKMLSVENSQMKTDRMAYYIQEYINVVMSESVPSSHTFQIENNQILSLIRGKDVGEELEQGLGMLKMILDRDKDYFLATIAISSVYEHSSQFNDAYLEVQEMAQRARPVDESQIIRERRHVPPQLVFTVQQEQELYANLQAGNHEFCISFLNRMLEQYDRKEASIQQLKQLAAGIIARVVKILAPYGVDAESSMQQRHMALMKECYTLDQFKQFYEHLFLTSATIILSIKDEQDPTISFILDYVENRYAEDLSLELLADKLNLSVAYLSVYIKEKTGTNFSEHLNAIRIRKAKELLTEHNLSVQEIGLQIGYQNVTSFIRMFKKITGIPPGEYRKSKRM